MTKLLLAAALAAGLQVTSATAQDYPSRPITIIVPFPAGGPTDTLARILGDRMKDTLGQTIVVENVTGAGATIGVGRAVQAAPDGYTVILGNWTSHVGAPALYPVQWNVLTDLEPVARLSVSSLMIVGKTGLPANNASELIAWLKENPDKASAASVGAGSGAHICGLYFQEKTGTRFQFVPYRGGAPAMQDLIAGQIKLSCDNFATAWEQAKAGNARAIAVGSPKRYSFSPDVPTFAETLPGFEVLSAFGWVGQAGLDKAIVAKLVAELTVVGQDPDVTERLKALGVESSRLAGDAFAAYMRSERQRLAPIVEKAGIKPL
jgi:tripartite-type tricarboxylate transporter receptor subunit TctC